MGKEIRHTGGLRRVQVTKEDRKRWESEDTESTREFKEALYEWRNSKTQRVKRYFRKTKRRMNNFFGGPKRRRHYNSKPMLKNLLIFVVVGFLLTILYSNLEKLNEVVIIFLKVGASLLLVGAFIFVKYFRKLYKNIRYFIRIQRKWIKWVLAIVLLILLFFAYQNRDTLFDPAIEYYNETDFGRLSPFSFTFEDITSELDVEDLDESEASTIQKILATPPERKSECQTAFNYINDLRDENGRDELIWDDRVYELAVSRSKDMHKRGYFDHVTPEGKCAEDFKQDFGIMEYGNFAENIGGMTHYEGGTPVEDTSVNEAVDSWMRSRGHKYALMFPYNDYKKGSIGCYYSICTFLVLTKEPFQCVSGNEGLAYWETVGKQPGEI